METPQEETQAIIPEAPITAEANEEVKKEEIVHQNREDTPSNIDVLNDELTHEELKSTSSH